MQSDKEVQDMLTALDICQDMGVRCLYETDKACPYRTGDFTCRRADLMRDAHKFITRTRVEYQRTINESEARLQKVREAVCGPLDDEYCNYDCEVP